MKSKLIKYLDIKSVKRKNTFNERIKSIIINICLLLERKKNILIIK